MDKSRQYLYLGILFLGLILLSAGIGALAAGEMVFGIIFLTGGLFFIVLGAMILILVRKKQKARAGLTAPAEPIVHQVQGNTQEE